MFSSQAVFSCLFVVLMVWMHHIKADSSEEDEKIMHRCMDQAGVQIEEIKEFRTDQASENMMCFMKCRYESEGAFDEKGVLIKEIIQESYDDLGWTDEQRGLGDQCLDKMKPVKECGDLKDFFQCIPVINFGELMERK